MILAVARIALPSEGANGQGKEGRIVLQIKIRCSICQGDTAPTRAAQRLALAPCRPILHQAALTKAHTIQRAGRIRTIQGFPVHMTLGVPDDLAPAEDTVFRYDWVILIKVIEGHYPFFDHTRDR